MCGYFKKDKSEFNLLLPVKVTVTAIFALTVFAANKSNPDIYKYIKSNITASEAVQADIQEESVIENTVEETEIVEEEETTQTKSETDSVAVMATIDDEITVPVHGEITSRFGGRTNPISGVNANHSGVDIAAKSGTDIKAAYSGVVEDTGTGEKAGKYVKLLHSDGSETLYCHCSEICVDKNDLVRAGDVIAKVGSTGWSTGAHLHFEIHRNSEAIDPLTVLDENDGSI